MEKTTKQVHMNETVTYVRLDEVERFITKRIAFYDNELKTFEEMLAKCNGENTWAKEMMHKVRALKHELEYVLTNILA
jgi:hypothetical protein